MTAYQWAAVIEGGITGTAGRTGESAWSVRVSPKQEGKLTAMLRDNKPVVCRFFKAGSDTIVERCLLVAIWKYSEGQTVCDFVGVGAPITTHQAKCPGR